MSDTKEESQIIDLPPSNEQQPKVFDYEIVPKHWREKYGDTNLAKFHHYLQKLECPEYFITWNYNYAISSCLGRKVWLGQEKDFPIFPNLFLFFVGPPASSKSLPAVKTAQILSDLKELVKRDDRPPYVKNLVNIPPDSATLEALYDAMSDSTDNVKIKPTVIYVHSSVSFCLGEEVAILFREKTNDIIMFLTAGWNCGSFRRKIRGEKKELQIVNMCINFLGCCTPNWYRDMMANKLINEGFTGRMFHIFGNKRRWYSNNLRVDDAQQASLESLKRDHLKKVCKVCGELQFTPEAEAYLDHWKEKIYPKERLNPSPSLNFYYDRKRHHLEKLSIVAHYHNKLDKLITIDDVKLAQSMLLEIEPMMHHAIKQPVGNKESAIADAIINYLNNVAQTTRLDIIRKNFNLGTIEEIDRALTYLRESGEIFPVTIGKENAQGYAVMAPPPGSGAIITEEGEKIIDKNGSELNDKKLEQLIIGKRI